MFNDSNLMVTIIGVLATVLIPLIGVFLRRQEHRQLDVVIDREVALVNQVFGNLKNFSIVIEGKPASDQVVWMTGWVINSGNYDISNSIVERPLRLKIPDNMQWLRGSIEHCSNDLQCSLKIHTSQELEFTWVLLRRGEYIRFDALLRCPLEEAGDIGGLDSLLGEIEVYSRIENIPTGPCVSLGELGERYNPLKRRKRYVVPKLTTTGLVLAVLVLMWMATFARFELDRWFGDGFLQGMPQIVMDINGTPTKATVAVAQDGRVKLTASDNGRVFAGADALFLSPDIRVDRIRVRDRSKEWDAVVAVVLLTTGGTWGILYMWFPGMFLFRSGKRRTASALFALQREGLNSSASREDAAMV